jgi:DNA-binding response OmpR family regulator
MASPRILIVDDESSQRQVFRRLFELHGFQVSEAASASTALELARDASTRPDLILCDIAMPGTDGVFLLKILKAAPETGTIPAILMTGAVLPRGMLDASAERLGLGPVFIKGSPVAPLLARVKSLVRAQGRPSLKIVVDTLKRVVWIGDSRLPELPARRFQLLCALLRRPEGLSREELLAQVWEGSDNLNIVDVTVLRLRQDLKDFPTLSIETVCAGYRLEMGPYSV